MADEKIVLAELGLNGACPGTWDREVGPLYVVRFGCTLTDHATSGSSGYSLHKYVLPDDRTGAMWWDDAPGAYRREPTVQQASSG